jgi:FtsP/CotA-like multicopper oxidase with cupredoxin domain
VCPSGAPVRHFDVVSIDVDITLNRFHDHDPLGQMYTLKDNVAAVRAQETSRTVSIGEHGNDAIQPLAIRANEGDCVTITYQNQSSKGDYGIHIDGLAFAVASSGDAVGKNAPTNIPKGATAAYTFYVPTGHQNEGAHYLHPGPGNREAVAHGLWGALIAEPPGSSYLNPNNGQPLKSGWEAVIKPAGAKSFREYMIGLHEVGDEDYDVTRGNGKPMPKIDPHTESYRPGSRGINYRSEPFINRLDRAPLEDSHSYSSYTFGDPTTPTPRAYLGDPTKFRLIHGGSELFHVFHLHGGGDRWRFDPVADTTYNYQDTGLNKSPVQYSNSERLDSQATGPGESYTLEIEGGAGGVQQAAGDFLWHCHIAHHYLSGMWAFWRTYDTLQPDLMPLPDRAALPASVSSAGLIGRTMPDGTVITKSNLDAWIRPQLPPQGKRNNTQDAAVLDWTIDKTNANKPVYLNEPEDTSSWPDFKKVVPGHPSGEAGDVYHGNRPEIRFDPVNGRPAFPLLRTHVGVRPPFSPNQHSGAPWLGERADASAADGYPAPFDKRKDGLCPADSPNVRPFNLVGIETPIKNTKDGPANPDGAIFALADEKAGKLNGTIPFNPLIIRANAGDCVHLTLTSEMTDAKATDGFSKINVHVHHVQFDPQASDGVISGFSYEQSVRPYKLEDPQMTVDAPQGSNLVHLTSVAKFHAGAAMALGLGTDDIEPATIKAIDPVTKTIMLAAPLKRTHPAGEWAGVEFVQSLWYPDVVLDNVFFHDHVDGLHTWQRGMVGQIVVEPQGSTYHDPQSGAEIRSGTLADIHTTNPLIPGVITGSFREFAYMPIDQVAGVDSTINLRAEPLANRGLDPSLWFSSTKFGDPYTPMPKAYPGDPLVIRTISANPSVDTLHVDGMRFFKDPRYTDGGGNESTPINTFHQMVSEKFTVAMDGGAGGPQHTPGDYIYGNGVGHRVKDGAWGLIRVLDGSEPDLQPLPGYPAPATPATPHAVTGDRPAEGDPGNPGPAGAPTKTFLVSAVDVKSSAFNNAVRSAFVPCGIAQSVTRGLAKPDPLVLHVAAGDCVVVTLRNQRALGRVSFHADGLIRTPGSSGIDAGFTPEQTVAVNGQRTYKLYADTAKLGASLVANFGSDEGKTDGLFGAIVTSEKGAYFTNPVNGAPVTMGTQVDVHVPLPGGGTRSYRDFTLLMAEHDPKIGQDHMPYPTQVKDGATINYRSANIGTNDTYGFSSAFGDPATPLLRAYVGDKVVVHALVAAGTEQTHVFNLGGQPFPLDRNVSGATMISSIGVGPMEKFDAQITAGGMGKQPGDYFYGDQRRPLTQAGSWGLMRVLSDATCPIRPLDGGSCLGSS